MKKITKIIALVLAMVTLLSVMCVPAFAEYSYPMSVTIYYKDEAGNNLKSALSTSINAAATTKPTWTSPSISGYALKNDSDSVVTYREYYKFLGWSISSTASTPDYAPGDTYTNEGNTTLFAVWEYINYDFSVSGLTVDPNESRQYDTVQVHFRLDSWDQKNAYSVIPVEVVLNGSTIYSTFVDFAIYGVNYVDFDLNVGALEGLQSITA